jgi:plasmid maintenance system killer protein
MTVGAAGATSSRVSVSGGWYQWRLIFRWDGSRGEAEGVYLDDHSYR